MNKGPNYFVDRLRLRDAAAIARVEAAAYPPEHRVGKKIIWAELAEAEVNAENLSLGLFIEQRLVAYFLLFVLNHRSEAAEYFGVQLPATLDGAPRVIYMADVVVLPAHRRGIPLFREHLACLLRARADLRELPLEAFATEDRTEFWQGHARFLSGLGLGPASEQAFYDSQLKQTIKWLSFKRLAFSPRTTPLSPPHRAEIAYDNGVQISRVRSLEQWDALRADWDQLMESHAAPDLLRSFTFVRTWWSHFEFSAELFILVAWRAGTPIALLPLHIITSRRLGRRLRCLTLIGQFAGAANFQFPIGNDPDVAQAFARQILSASDQWDHLSLKLPPQTPLLHELMRNLGGSAFLAHRLLWSVPSSKRAHSKIDFAELTHQCTTYDNASAAKNAVEQFLSHNTEGRSLDLMTQRFSARAVRCFLLDLAMHACAELKLQVHLWSKQGEPFAQCVGMCWRNVFYPLYSDSAPPESASHSEDGAPIVSFKASKRTGIGYLLHLTHILSRLLKQPMFQRRPFRRSRTSQSHHDIGTPRVEW